MADTSFLYALFSETDEWHARAVKEAGKPGPVSIPSEIMSETISLVHYRHGFRSARAAGDWIRTQENIQITLASERILELAWKTFMSGGGQVSYPDSIVIAHCQVNKATSFAFDESIIAFNQKRAGD